MSFWSDITGIVSKYYTEAWAAATGGAVSNASGDVGSTVSTAKAAVAAGAGEVTTIQAIWAQLTNAKMWKSLGWLLLGIVLMAGGVLLWIGPSAERRSPIGLAAGAAREVAT
jgi:hypothetical protein